MSRVLATSPYPSPPWKPIIIAADSFGLTAGIAKLSEAVNGIPIVRAASFTFDLVFETGDRLPH